MCLLMFALALAFGETRPDWTGRTYLSVSNQYHMRESVRISAMRRLDADINM